MNHDDAESGAWFSGIDPGDPDAAVTAIRDGSCEEPGPWPDLAVESGVVPDTDSYYDRLHDATVAATRDAVTELERADDQQLIHAIRAMDDCRRTANELAERLAEWGGSLEGGSGSGIEYARRIRGGETSISDPSVRSLADRVVDLADEADALE